MKEFPVDDVLLKRERKIVDDLRHGPGLSAIEIVLIDCIDRLSRELQTALSQNEKLAQAVKEFPKMADGVTIVPGMTLRWTCRGTFFNDQFVVKSVHENGWSNDADGYWLQAAEAAQKSRGEGVSK